MKVIKNFLLLILICFLFASCKNEEVNFQSADTIKSFANLEEYHQEINRLGAITEDELAQFEESTGFKSFGRISNELYAEAESLTSIKEIKEFVQIHNKHLVLLEDEDGDLILETTLYNNPGRYVVNESQIVKIGDSYLKLFTSGESFGSLSQLMNLTEDQLPVSDMGQVFEFSNNRISDVSNNCGTTIEKKGTNSGNKMIITVKAKIFDNLGIQTAKYDVSIINYKKQAGIWFQKSKPHSYYGINFAYDVKIGGVWYREYYYLGESDVEFKARVGSEWVYLSLTGPDPTEVHFGGFEVYGQNSSVPRFEGICDPNNIVNALYW